MPFYVSTPPKMYTATSLADILEECPYFPREKMGVCTMFPKGSLAQGPHSYPLIPDHGTMKDPSVPEWSLKESHWLLDGGCGTVTWGTKTETGLERERSQASTPLKQREKRDIQHR